MLLSGEYFDLGEVRDEVIDLLLEFGVSDYSCVWLCLQRETGNPGAYKALLGELLLKTRSRDALRNALRAIADDLYQKTAEYWDTQSAGTQSARELQLRGCIKRAPQRVLECIHKAVPKGHSKRNKAIRSEEDKQVLRKFVRFGAERLTKKLAKLLLPAPFGTSCE